MPVQSVTTKPLKPSVPRRVSCSRPLFTHEGMPFTAGGHHRASQVQEKQRHMALMAVRHEARGSAAGSTIVRAHQLQQRHAVAGSQACSSRRQLRPCQCCASQGDARQAGQMHAPPL